MLQVFYTVLIAASVALIVVAVCRALSMVYPSLKLFFPAQDDALPYGAAMSVVALAFLLASYVPPMVVLGGVLILGMMAYGLTHPLPAMSLPVTIVLAVVLALLGEAERIQTTGMSTMMVAVLLLYPLVPLAAYVSVKREDDSAPLLWLMCVLVLVAIAAPVVTGSMTHGTPAALLVASAIAAALYCHRHKPGRLGMPALLPMALVASHVGITLAHAGGFIPAIAYMAVTIAGFGVLALRQR